MGLSLGRELLEAARLGHRDRVRQLIQQDRVDLNTRETGTDWTPLHWSAFRGHFFVVEELATHGADLNALDRNGMTPLHWATLYSRNSVIWKLVEHGADVNIQDKNLRIPLLIAITWCSVDVIKMLADKTICVNTSDNGRRSPLHIAAQKGYRKIAEILLERGADMFILDKNHQSPMDIATDDVKELFNQWYCKLEKKDTKHKKDGEKYKIDYSIPQTKKSNTQSVPKVQPDRPGIRPPCRHQKAKADPTYSGAHTVGAHTQHNKDHVDNSSEEDQPNHEDQDQTQTKELLFNLVEESVETGVEAHEDRDKTVTEVKVRPDQDETDKTLLKTPIEVVPQEPQTKQPAFQRITSWIREKTTRQRNSSSTTESQVGDEESGEYSNETPPDYSSAMQSNKTETQNGSVPTSGDHGNKNLTHKDKDADNQIPDLEVLLAQRSTSESEASVPQATNNAGSKHLEPPSEVLQSPVVDLANLTRSFLHSLSRTEAIKEISETSGCPQEYILECLRNLARGLPTEEANAEEEIREPVLDPSVGVPTSERHNGARPKESSRPVKSTVDVQSFGTELIHSKQDQGQQRTPLENFKTSVFQIISQGSSDDKGGSQIVVNTRDLAEVLSQFKDSISDNMVKITQETKKFQEMAALLEKVHEVLVVQSRPPQIITMKQDPMLAEPATGWRKQLMDDGSTLPEIILKVNPWTDIRRYDELKDSKRVYPMRKKPRGLAVIININIVKPFGTHERKGSGVDVKLMEQLFSQLHFDIEMYMDLRADEIKDVLKDLAADESLKQYDCFALCVMSHGQHGAILGTDGRRVNIDDIVNSFANNICPSLMGKPKIFFIQSCRGVQMDVGNEYEADEPPSEPQKLPDRTDMCVMHSTTEGYRSFRNTEKGSVFIRAVAEIFCCFASECHLLELATDVISHVIKQEQGGRVFGEPIYLQSPEVTLVSLSKRLYFFPGL